MHDWWHVGDARYGNDRCVVDHPLFFLSHPLFFLSHPLFSSLTLCSVCGVAVEAGGVRMDLIFVCSFLMSSLPLTVVPSLVVTLANSLVSARKCWCGVRFGT